MTDNRTTERLRALLDERGVEYKTHDIIVGKAVTWHGSVCDWVALPDERGLAVGVYKDYLTPEQAINATLGDECHAYEQRITSNGSDWGEIMRGAYDDLMAAACESCTLDEFAELKAHVAATLGTPEIVRCGDCMHMIHFWHHDDERWQCADEMLEGLDVSPSFYCAWGERKEGE